MFEAWPDIFLFQYIMGHVIFIQSMPTPEIETHRYNNMLSPNERKEKKKKNKSIQEIRRNQTDSIEQLNVSFSSRFFHIIAPSKFTPSIVHNCLQSDCSEIQRKILIFIE